MTLPSFINMRGLFTLAIGVVLVLHSYGLLPGKRRSSGSLPTNRKKGSLAAVLPFFVIAYGLAELSGLTGRRHAREQAPDWRTHGAADGVITVSFPLQPVRHERVENSPDGPMRIEILDCETPAYYLAVTSTPLPSPDPGALPPSVAQEALASILDQIVPQFHGQRIEPDSVSSIDGWPSLTTTMRGAVGNDRGMVIVTLFFAGPQMCNVTSFVPDRAPSGTESVAERFHQSISVNVKGKEGEGTGQPASAAGLPLAAEP